MKNSYRTSPYPTEKVPPGIPYIIGNEFAERFSYYGMRAILVVFMTQYLLDDQGRLAPLSESEATAYFHLFVSATYFTPFLGALLADGLLGKYRTIIILSMVYCFGHFMLALDDTLMGLFAGQSLIALGAGGIKPCVSAHVGDQFGSGNQHLLSQVFSWFYLAVNVGAFVSMLFIPWLLKIYGSSVAFAVPGILMLMATVIFWSGRFRFVHVPAAGRKALQNNFSRDGLRSLRSLVGIYLFIAMFWALFEQNGSSWVLQAQHMDRVIFGVEVLPSQIQAANPLLIIVLTPLFYKYLYPKLNKFIQLTYVNKMVIGLFMTVISFVIIAGVQVSIDAGSTPSIAWQLLAYVLLTAAEVMVSITCLEFSYTQAPNTMKSVVMSLYLASIALGNLFTGVVNVFIENPDGSSRLAGAEYFWFFVALMLLTAISFLWYSRRYQERSYLQDES